jgi:hypothetical protein
VSAAFPVVDTQGVGDHAPAANQPADDLAARLDRIEGLLQRLVAAEESAPAQRSRKEEQKWFLSKTSVARLLGIDPKTTLRDLIHDKRLLTVPVGNRRKVPMSEIERVEREGTVRSRSNRAIRQPASTDAPMAADLAAGISKLKV